MHKYNRHSFHHPDSNWDKMLRVRERWEHSSYWITSPFSPSDILITHIFAAILVFTFYGKIQPFIVSSKYKSPDFPNTVKTKAVTQFISYLMIQKPGPNQLLASADASPLKCTNCTCFYQWLLWLITAKINILCFLRLSLHRILLTLYSVQASCIYSS